MYYNYGRISISCISYTYFPNYSALVKIGDLFYEEHTRGSRALSDVVEMYKKAALKNDPQVTHTWPEQSDCINLDMIIMFIDTNSLCTLWI